MATPVSEFATERLRADIEAGKGTVTADATDLTRAFEALKANAAEKAARTAKRDPHRPVVVAAEQWALIGETSADTLIVRGGKHPVAIRVSHGDSSDLIELLTDANVGAALRLEVDRLAKVDDAMEVGRRR